VILDVFLSSMIPSDSERQARNLKALLGVAKALASEIKLDNLLQVIVAKAAEVMDAERATLFLYDKPRNELWSKTTQKLEINEIRVPLGVGIAGTVAKTRALINIADAYADPRFDPTFDVQTGYRTRSILCLALIGNGDSLIGVIQVLNKKNRQTFDEIDESLLAGLSDHITVALERGRLIEAYVEKERLEEGLKLAHDIQMSMLPKTFPPFPQRRELDIFAAITPAKKVGGDFYDFFFLDEDRLCFAIGDVSGKGVPAALFMAVVKTLFKAIASRVENPTDILSTVNQEICRDNDFQMFTTLFCGILNTRTGEIKYSNGGHNPPYHISRGGVQQVPKTGGRVLGLVEESTYGSGRLVLGPGETIVLYTDGVTEAMDPEGKFFSEQRLESILTQTKFASARKQLEHLTNQITLFAAGAEQADDITALAIRYLGPAASKNEEMRVTIKNRLPEIARLSERLDEFAAGHQLTSSVLHDLNLALEEAVTNIISHGYSDNREHEILVRIRVESEEIIAELKDDARPFNPLTAPEADVTKPVDERKVGGLGIHLMRKLMDRIEYQRLEDGNLLIMKKNIEA
jgi:serine phosphatase RsbU (regulator of sigma subunit)/anti-sigma regulatory factor (Ser/Thr protein kinase)